jgi:Rrp15p
MKGKSPLRSLPRPSGQHKGGKKGGKRGAAAAQVTWDHDRSDDESSGRKRQRVESDDEDAVHRLSDGDADASSSEDENDEGKQAAAAQEADVSGGSESEAEDVDSQDEAAEGDKGGGMGDVMARILGQQLTTESAPVLAKRRTKAMKEMEAEADRKAAAVARRAERRAQQTQQLHIPDASTMEHERQLKKIATRGGEHLLVQCYLLGSSCKCSLENNTIVARREVLQATMHVLNKGSHTSLQRLHEHSRHRMPQGATAQMIWYCCVLQRSLF